jgi:hypothetical protein
MEEKKQTVPPWLGYVLGVLLSAAIAFIGAKWGVTPQPIPIPFPGTVQVVPYSTPQSTCNCSTAGIEAKAEIARARPLRNLLVKALKKRLPAEYTQDQIDAALAQIEAESDRPFLDWFTNGGFEKLIEMILRILTLLK